MFEDKQSSLFSQKFNEEKSFERRRYDDTFFFSLFICSLHLGSERVSRSREALLQEKAQYDWPPCTNQFRLPLFILKTLFTFYKMKRSIVLPFYKIRYLNEEVNCTEPSLSVSIPWLKVKLPIKSEKSVFKRLTLAAIEVVGFSSRSQRNLWYSAHLWSPKSSTSPVFKDSASFLISSWRQGH